MTEPVILFKSFTPAYQILVPFDVGLICSCSQVSAIYFPTQWEEEVGGGRL